MFQRRVATIKLIGGLVFVSCLLLLSACGTPTGKITVTVTATPAPTEPLFLTTQIAVLAPAPAHPGDSITIITQLRAEVYANTINQSPQAATDAHLYGPFPSAAALQQAIGASTATEGPSGWNDLLHAPGLGGATGGILTSTFDLPRSLAPGLYDLVVIAALPGGRAAARSDTPIQIVG
ncbi:MAG: hypothetical protein OJF49_002856 [Ktedonobacterales bacterium]|jgi:hypothetical protein|nr:MAG: hypothetical protein OJF49_002856 [Ktedonobacterales bacterium]